MTTLNGLSAAELNTGVEQMKSSKRQFSSPIPIANQTSRRRVSAAKSTGVEKIPRVKPSTRPSLIHKLLFQLIMFVFKFYQLIRLFLLRVFYSVEEYLDLLGLRTMNRPPVSASAPHHVCIVLNESVDDEKGLRDRFELLVDLMSQHGTRLVSVYESPKNRLLDAELKRTIVNKYSANKIDANNNSYNGWYIKITSMFLRIIKLFEYLIC